MKLQQVSDNCFASLNERNRVCDANSGLINLGGGLVIDTQSDLSHARRMIDLFGRVWPGMPRRVVNTHEDGDHVWGNQLFEGAEIIAHRTLPARMKDPADPRALQKLLDDASRLLPRLWLRAVHPGVLAVARQLQLDYDFDGITLVPPTTLRAAVLSDFRYWCHGVQSLSLDVPVMAARSASNENRGKSIAARTMSRSRLACERSETGRSGSSMIAPIISPRS